MPGGPIIIITQKGRNFVRDHNLLAPRGSPGYTKVESILLELFIKPMGVQEYRLGNKFYWRRMEKYVTLENLHSGGLIS